MKFDPDICKTARRQLLSQSLQRVNIKTIFRTSVTDDVPHQVLGQDQSKIVCCQTITQVCDDSIPVYSMYFYYIFVFQTDGVR